MGKIKHLVVDANAFVNNLPLQDMGENIYTVPEVVSEIRDAATRQRLQVLPYDLRLKEPLYENVQFVTKFSKATGDYPSLSAVDIKLMALTYQVTKENLDGETFAKLLKSEPEPLKKETVMGSGNVPKKKEAQETGSTPDTSNQVKVSENTQNISIVETQVAEIKLDEKHTECPDEDRKEEKNEDHDSVAEEDSEESDSESSGEGKEEEEDDDDEGGWITPSNYKSKLKEMDGSVEPENDLEQIPVACLTTDFAMQNVMLHIGLRVMSNNGMLIRHLRTYILRCYACFQTTSVMTKTFCPSCGNKTLKKVSVSRKPDGTLVLHLSRRVNLTGRGKKYPLPAPKGGKHANNPILAEDQPVPQQRPSKMALQKNNPLGTDYIANSSPFTVNDVYSRASVLGINTKYSGANYWDKKNPNEARRRTGKKKKN